MSERLTGTAHRLRLAAALVLLVLGGCSVKDPTNKTASAETLPAPSQLTDDAKRQFAALETSGSPPGEVLAAIHVSDPTLYGSMIDIAAKPGWSGTALEAMQIARPMYVQSLARRVPFASDEDVGALIELSITAHKALLEKDPMLCAEDEKADPDKVRASTPEGLIDRRYRLEAHILRTADPAITHAPQDEIEEWKAKAFRHDDPHLEGAQYFEIADPSIDQAKKICQAELFILETIAKEKQPRRAYLY